MKTILFILTVFALAILLHGNTRENKKYKAFYFKTLHTDLTNTEIYLIDTLDNYKNDSLVYRLREINLLLSDVSNYE